MIRIMLAFSLSAFCQIAGVFAYLYGSNPAISPKLALYAGVLTMQTYGAGATIFTALLFWLLLRPTK